MQRPGVKRERSATDLEEDSTFELKNTFFDIFVHAALDGKVGMERLIELCKKYGKTHGDALRKRMESSSSYSRVYSSTIRRQSRGGKTDEKDAESARDEVDNDPYSHAFYKIFHNGKGANTSIKSETSSSTEGAGNNAKRARLSESVPSSSTSGGSVTAASQPSNKSTTVLVAGMKGVEEVVPRGVKGKEPTAIIANKFTAFLTLLGRRIDLGDFPREREAALAHDRALIRALGPSQCAHDQLNFPITSYAKDAMESFMRCDAALKRALHGTSWDGVKDCDFGFLLTQSMNKSPPKKKQNGNSAKKDSSFSSNPTQSTAANSLYLTSFSNSDIEAATAGSKNLPLYVAEEKLYF